MNLRNRPSSLIVLMMLLISIVVADTVYASDPGAYFFDMTMGDFPDELIAAKEQGKKGIMLFFESADCPFCIWMKNNVLNQPGVQKFYKKNFLNFQVDTEGDVEITDFNGKTMRQKDFTRINRVRATPTIIFYDLKGRELTKYFGATSSAKEFLWLGEYVEKGIYKKMPFLKYKRLKLKEQGQR